MSHTGWKRLLAGWPWFHGPGSFPLPAYSEYMPPPYLLRKPYGGADLWLLDDEDPWGWPVTEYEEALMVQPGLHSIACQLLRQLTRLGRGHPKHGISKAKCKDNPYWPAELAEHAGALRHERYVLLMPLALSRTLDDKGRVRWTLFGASEQGPARPFWRSFFTAPDQEAPAEEGLGFFRRLLHAAYAEPDSRLRDLRAAGFRILPQGDEVPFAFWREGPLPSWTAPLLWEPGQSLRGVRYLLTFRPFERLPAPVRRAYLAGELHLLPFPGSLLFWGCPLYHGLQQKLPFAVQVPLLQQVDRHEGPLGMRVPQAGWIHERRPGGIEEHPHGPLRETYKRTHRWARVHRDEDELATADEDKLAHVIFSSAPGDVGLYNKPLARNVELWTHEFRLLLDGPRASYEEVRRAGHAVEEGGVFGYRFLFPAMRVGRHELYWHRPLVAYLTGRAHEPALLPDAPTGYLTAYVADRPDLAHPVELWPRLLRREIHTTALELFQHVKHERHHQTVENIRKLLDTWQLLGGGPLPRSLARRLLSMDSRKTLDGWLAGLPRKASDRERGRWLADELRRCLGPKESARDQHRKRPPPSLTFRHTARRAFEVAFWKTIAFLSAGDYVNKNNADPVLDIATQAVRPGERRDLDLLSTYLLGYYTELIARQCMAGQAAVGEIPFAWETEFKYPWMGGWLQNQEGKTQERDLLVMIPGRDRSRAVIMADHYDTAYMEDHYEPDEGGTGARLAAAGADDNCSATATLMLGAPIFLEMSRAGRLGCDVWLIHLTGEEFPADSLGARQLTQYLVEGGLKVRLTDGTLYDLSGVAVQGAYVLDMVAHNTRRGRDIFQISPGTTRESMGVAYQAHLAAEAWNASVPFWNQRAERRGCGRGRRVHRADEIPPVARHLHLHAEVRTPYDRHSSLYNTDGTILSNAGVPVALFMENYDINRTGYHDSADTMANINLDYGAAVSAIAIEAVARLATEERPG